MADSKENYWLDLGSERVNSNSFLFFLFCLYITFFLVPPSIVESPTDIIVTAGRTVEIRCSAYGAPKPIITWIKNNVHITEANRYSVSKSGTLSIRDVGKTDEGRYECAARNSIGAASAQMTLTVQSKIYLDFHPHLLVHLLFLGILQWQNFIFSVQSSWQDIIWLE